MNKVYGILIIVVVVLAIFAGVSFYNASKVCPGFLDAPIGFKPCPITPGH